MNDEPNIETQITEAQNSPKTKHLKRLKIIGALLTLAGIVLFAYFVYSVGIGLIWTGIGRIGFDGFAFLMFLYFLRIVARALAWTLAVHEPHKLTLRDTLPAVIIGEALSSLIPLGILISGTSKAVAVHRRVPLVVGLSSITTENLFYSLVTGLFIVGGALAFLQNFELETIWIAAIDFLIVGILALTILAVLIIVRQWHLASNLCEWLYNRNFGKNILETGRLHVRLFENLIFDFYRQYPRRFLPICLYQLIFHALGILEVWFVLSRISQIAPSFFASFLLESMSRVIMIVFKLVPFLIGVDEAGARLITQTLALGAGVGITLAIIRKGRILFWTAIGLILIAKRGLSVKELTETLK
ncbi:MAG: flippase-like domain-containing protein [Acidobacteriota bacterium]|nr:flippase-like domain-containing protein [Acidobacteriota bacterium]